MIIDTVHLCYDPAHRPFSSDGAVKIQNLDSQKPASKIIRAVLRVDGLDASSWEDYSLHKCYCKSKGKGSQEVDDLVDPTLTLDELGIGEGHWLFIRKRSEEDEGKEDTEKTIQPLSRKRKERSEDDVTFQSSPPSAPTPKSNLINLESDAAATARSISKLLGGHTWKTQSIGKLGLIKTKSAICLRALQRAIKTSLQIPQVVTVEAGLFNTDLVEALTRAYHQRTSNCSKKSHDNYFWELGLSDYGQANELLKGKIGDDGSWEKSSLSHLDKSSLSTPASRYLLSDSGLSGKHLSTARDVSTFWNNDKWINQAPLPGLSPISLTDTVKNSTLRKIALLTRVEPGEAAPDGFPPIVLRALRQAIQQRVEKTGPGSKGSRYGWKQSKDIAQALEILKRDLKSEEMARSTSSASTSVNERLNKKAKKGFN